MPDRTSQPKSRLSLTAFVWIAAVYIVVHTFPVLSPIILSFLMVVILSLALNPVVTWLRRLLGGRTVATLLVLMIFLMIAGLTGWAFYTPVKKSTSKFVQKLPDYWERIQKPLLKLEHKATISGQRAKAEAATEASREEGANAAQVPAETNSVPAAAQTGGMQNGFSQFFGGVAKTLTTVASNAATFAMIGITVFVGVIFTLLNPKPLVGFLYSLVPSPHHDKALVVGKRVADMVPRWALATILGMTIIGAMVFLAMWPILGFTDAVVLGLIALVLEAVPYVGPMLAVIPAILLAVGKGGMAPLWVLGAYAVIQVLENNLIAPVIVAGRLKLNPVAAIFSIVLCVTTFGVLGVLIAVPMVAIVNILHEELYRPRFLPDMSDDDLEKLAQETLERAKPERPRRKLLPFRRKVPVHNGNGH